MALLSMELVSFLKKLGTKYVFGIPGGPSISYLDEMRKNDIEFITVANEQSAAIMADVMGRITGMPGICHATFGPGATNLSTGVGEALLDRSPLIAFTTVFPDADINRRKQMNIDHQSVFNAVTKKTERLSVENFNSLLEESVKVAMSEKPGSVHIGLPTNLSNEQVTLDVDLDFENLIEELESPESEVLKKVSLLINQSKKPIIAVGLTAFRYGLSDALNKIINKNNIPVVVTPMAKGMISEDKSMYAGVLFHAKSDIVANIYRQADLVIGIGYDPIEFSYEDWMPVVPLIHVDTEKADIASDYLDRHDVLGDIGESIEYLSLSITSTFDWDPDEIISNKEKLYEALTPKTHNFNPADAVLALQEVIPDDNIVTVGVGAHLHLMGQLWKTSGGQLLITNGWSAMGFGIPAAIGAKLASPSSTVVCVTGDGGFLMNCGDLMVARRKGLKLVVVVFVDEDYSLIKVKQNWKEVQQYATTVHQEEYFRADYFLGIPIFKANTSTEMKEALKNAFNVDGPVIIEAKVDGSIYQNLITRNHK
jgi:acetolactate synthase-1/2/3 large subunit